MSVKLIPLNFGGYELPEFKESKKGDWYEYGTDRPYKNTYPDYLTKLYNESSKHNQIINSKVKFIVGQGFVIDEKLTFTEKAYVNGFIRHPNEDENLDDLIGKLAKDKKVYGGFCLQVRMSKNNKIAAINHIDFADVRTGVDNDLYYYTDDWSARNPKNNDDFKVLQQFPYNEDARPDVDYVIYYKEYRPDLGAYPLPDYVSAIPYLESDAEIANFTLSNIKNNLSAGYVVSFNNGSPSDEDMQQIERRFKDYATGADNAGKPLLSFTDQNSDHPQILPIPVNGQDERFINLNNQIREEIFTAHGITSPQLFGIKENSGLGNNADEIAVASQLYQNLQIDPEQKVFNELINSILNYNGINGQPIRIQKIEPVQRYFSETAVLGAMTQNELREKIGLPQSEVETNKVAEAIGILSPLVATKVLDNMSIEEIRQLIGLTGSVTRTTESLKKEFADVEDEILFNQLEATGIDIEEIETVQSFVKPITSLEDARQFETQLLKDYKFAIDRVLTGVEKSILDLLIDNPNMPVTEIAEALQLEQAEVNDLISELQNAGALDNDFKPTEDAKESIQKPEDETFIVYKYAERPDAPAVQTQSRPFCIRMMALSRVKRYTLQQLELLTNDFGQSGIDIFTKRGGWYNNPKTGQTTPYCRHIWEMQIVRKKK
jgi:capsid portal protein